MNQPVISSSFTQTAVIETRLQNENETAQTLKVLFVKDSLAEQLRLKTLISKVGYETICSSNSDEALRLLEYKQIPLAVCDWSMPGLAGIDLCRKFSNEEMQVRLQAGARIIRLREKFKSQNLRLESKLSREEEIHQHIQRDLNAAARMQRELLASGHSPFPHMLILSSKLTIERALEGINTLLHNRNSEQEALKNAQTST